MNSGNYEDYNYAELNGFEWDDKIYQCRPSVNEKKPLQILNRTNYFNPDTTRTWNTISSPSSYQSRRIKIDGYENRLYWEYRYCDEHSGDTYFYTLTYNDEAMPKYTAGDVSFNCFNYEDLRYLLNGGFKKQLLRKYGTTFKYFVGAELGDGKGSRGMHNNPHYHVLFFLRSAENPRYPYIRISPEDFRNLVKVYWQGFDETRDGKIDYRTAKFGIAREGENLGRVKDFRACMYCAKYVCKDVNLRQREYLVRKALEEKIGQELDVLSPECYVGFYEDVLKPKFQITCDYPSYQSVSSYIETYGLEDEYMTYIKLLVQDRVRLAFNEYRNRYCNKCRVSQGLGDYALSHIDDLMDPRVAVPSKDGFKYRPLNMYYYRKLYTEVVKDPYGQPIRVLNELGIRYKMYHLPEQLKKMVQRTKQNVEVLDRSLFEKMVKSDVNTNVSMTYDEYITIMNNNNKDEIIERYANYKQIYENRFFRFSIDRLTGECDFPCLNPTDDYYRFIQPSYYEVDFRPGRLNRFLSNLPEGYLSYNAHPDFLCYTCVFRVFDLIADYLFVQMDNKKQKEAEEVAEVKRFHDKIKLKKFYDFFN